MTNSSITISALKNLPEKPTENLPEKQCTKCGRVFPLTEEFFYKHNLRKDGFFPYCKICNSQQNKKWKENNKEKNKKINKEYKENNKEKFIGYYKNNKKKYKEYYKNNREYYKNYYKNNKESYKKSYKTKFNLSCLFNSVLAQRLSLYDEVRENQDGYLEVKCAYCGKWVTPKYPHVKSRLTACESIYGYGECRIYCNDNNDNCKLACPTFKRINYPKGFKPATSREVEPLIRQLCFERDNWTCQHCGVTSREAQLHCHHIIGVVHSPMEQNDISNTITLCKACHKALHKKSGCRYQDYKCA